MEGNDAATTKMRRIAEAGRVFTPGAPVDEYALFAGRESQIMDVVNAINQKGQHVVLFGERGVGKTSLANILKTVFVDDAGNPVWTVKVNCGTADTFHSLWARLFREMGREDEFQAQWSETPPDPEDVRYLLERLDRRLLIVVDELDRFEDNEGLSLLADTIKSLSDNAVDVTLILVGVAGSIMELVGDHLSVERALTQIPLPRMSTPELEQIIDTGLGRLGMGIKLDAKKRTARLSEGLPYYTHLLALHASQRALQDDRTEVLPSDVESAIGNSVAKAQHSIRTAYQTAVRSTRDESQFTEVLLACALAEKDDMGYFTAASVREPLSRIMDKPREIPHYARHLHKFAEDKRGCVLEKSGAKGSHFYRFANPLLQPFVILNGVAHEIASEDVIRELQAAQAQKEPVDSLAASLGLGSPSEPEQLF